MQLTAEQTDEPERIPQGSDWSARQVRLDVSLVRATLLGLLFLWPLILFGRPAYISDSASYYKGGRAAFSYAYDLTSKRTEAPSLERSPTAPEVVDAASRGAQLTMGSASIPGVRSLTYSIMAYVFSAPGGKMWLLAGVQALLAAFLSAVALVAYGKSARSFFGGIAALAVVTPVAMVACLTVPDIFAGLLILSIALLTATYERLSLGVRAGLVLIATGAITVHMSHVAIAIGLTAVAIVALGMPLSRAKARTMAQGAVVAAPLLIGMALIASLNFGAFGSPSLTGKRFPLTLARSVADGPARWYLEKNCGRLSYAICEVYPDEVPEDLNEFLWGANGIKSRASPNQLERIRNEEAQVVVAAAQAYPIAELSILTRNFTRQLFEFEPAGFDTEMVFDANQNPVTRLAPHNSLWIRIIEKLSAVAVIVSLIVLALTWRKAPEHRQLIFLVLVGVVLNAAVCVYFSGITGRYQARVIWLIPLIALAVAWDGRAGLRKLAQPRASLTQA